MPEPPPPNAGDVAVVIIIVGALAIGLISVAVGQIVTLRDRLRARRQEQKSVKHSVRSEPIMSPPPIVKFADRQTDRADRPSVSEDNLDVPRLRLDKTKATIIEVLVYNGWQVGEIRAVIKGDNGVIGVEAEAARKRLGIDPPPRELRVRDEKGERVISF